MSQKLQALEVNSLDLVGSGDQPEAENENIQGRSSLSSTDYGSECCMVLGWVVTSE